MLAPAKCLNENHSATVLKIIGLSEKKDLNKKQLRQKTLMPIDILKGLRQIKISERNSRLIVILWMS